MTNVQCKFCGVLAVRLKSERTLVEVEHSARETGKHEPPTVNDRFTTGFYCCANAADLHGLTGRKDQFEHHQGVFDESLYLNKCREELHRKRECGDFIQWQLGFSPKEHIEMGILAEQRKLSQKVAEDERTWRERQSEREHTWRKEDADKARTLREEDVVRHEKTIERYDESTKRSAESAAKSQRVTWRIAIATGIVALATACAHWFRIVDDRRSQELPPTSPATDTQPPQTTPRPAQ